MFEDKPGYPSYINAYEKISKILQYTPWSIFYEHPTEEDMKSETEKDHASANSSSTRKEDIDSAIKTVTLQNNMNDIK